MRTPRPEHTAEGQLRVTPVDRLWIEVEFAGFDAQRAVDYDAGRQGDVSDGRCLR